MIENARSDRIAPSPRKRETKFRVSPRSATQTYFGYDVRYASTLHASCNYFSNRAVLAPITDEPMGQIAGISGNNYSQFGFGQQQDPSMLMGFALMSAFLSNDPRQMMGAFAMLAQQDPRSFLMFLGMMNPQLFQQLAQSLMGPQAGASGCPQCGGVNPMDPTNP